MTKSDNAMDDAIHEGLCGCGWQRTLEATLTNLVDSLTGDDTYARLTVQQREAYIEAMSVLSTLRAAQMGLETLNAR